MNTVFTLFIGFIPLHISWKEWSTSKLFLIIQYKSSLNLLYTYGQLIKYEVLMYVYFDKKFNNLIIINNPAYLTVQT